MNTLRRVVSITPLVLTLLLVLIPISPLYAASTCTGFIPATITTPANLIAAVNAAQSGSCPGADTIDLAGNTITFTTSTFTDGGDNLALPAITTPITITNGTITRSSATGFRFLLVDTGGTLTLNLLTISNGGGTGTSDGGAVRIGDGNLTVTNTTFLNNSAPDYGAGAILMNGTGSATISDSIFQKNQGNDGGSINMQSTGSLTIDRTRFEGNTANQGAGISVSSSTTTAITVRDSLFVGNSAVQAAAISVFGDNITLINSTMAGNNGPAIYVDSTANNTVFRNLLVWGNSSNLSGVAPSAITYTAAEGYAGATINTGYTTEDFFVNPLTAPTAANTGLNYTPASYDWTLRPFSPAIDAAQNSFASVLDLKGLTRRIDDTNITNTGNGTSPIVDMGAYERQASTCSSFSSLYVLSGTSNPQNLRDAIRCANLTPAADVIVLNGQTVTYTASFATYDGVGTALPQITTPITIMNGTISRSTAVGTPNIRLLDNASTGTLTIDTVILRDGNAGTGNGGAIYNSGVLTLDHAILRDHTAFDGGALVNAAGGQATINRSTMSGNVATNIGGAIYSLDDLTISNSTLTGNAANSSGGGGAIHALSTGPLTLINDTIVNNTGVNYGGIVVANGTAFLYNNILANNTPNDCARGGPAILTFSSGATNIIENNNGTCGTPGTTHLTADPQLGTLTGTPAYYPLASASSPAVNAGSNASVGGATIDQPGNTRIQQTTVDMGSYESPFASQTRTIQFNAATSSAAEAAGFGNLLRVTTSDSAVTTTAITVTVNVTGGTATAADYNRTGTITIPAGTANNALVSIASGITVTNETLVELDETIQLTLVGPTGGVLGAQASTTHTINNDDTATVTVADVAQAEGNAGTSTITFTVIVDNAVQGGFALDYTTINVSASTVDNDYGAASGTLTFAGTAGETETFTVTINGDTKVEANETFQVSFPSALATVSPGSLIITDTATGTITNDDSASVTIGDVSIVEGDAGTSLMTFTATLSNAVQGGFTVNYTTANGTATVVDSDYVTATGTLNFTGAAGQTRTFNVTINGDTKVESNETFMVSLNTVSNTGVTITDTATGTITNDDTASLTIADAAITEGNTGTSMMIFTATLDNAVQDGFTVNYATSDGTATTVDNDYVGTTGTLNFTGVAGQSRNIIVTINGDTKVEGNETFTVSLNTVSNAAVDITDTATGTINNNDAAAITIADVSLAENGTFTFTATLSNATGSAFSVDWALAVGTTNAADYVGGVLPTGGTLTFAGTTGETETFTVPVLDDAVVEPTETFTIDMTNFTTAGGFTVTSNDTATGTITDNDASAVTIADVSLAEGNAGTTLMTFTATLSNAVQGGFTVNYATANGTAVAGSDYVAATGTLTFAGTAGETQTFTVTINGDTALEPNETLTVSLNTVSKAGITITDTATGTITNDDGSTITIADVSNAEGNAGTSTFTFTATLGNAVAGGFTVNYATANGTATTADVDYVSKTGTLTFVGTAGETQTFTITVNGDTKVEGNETFTVSMNTVSNASVTITDTAIGTINNDDSAAVTIADVGLTEGDAGTTLMTFTATLDNAVQGGFTVNYATANGTATTGDADYVSKTGTLNFVGTASETQIFTITINGDTKVEGNETFTVSLNTVSNAGVTITDTATATITNDDSAAVTIASVSQNENGTFTFTAILDNATGGAFSVDWTLVAGTTTAADYVGGVLPTGGTLNFAGTSGETETFTVPVFDDAVVEGNETFTISMTNFTTAGGFTVTISDTAIGTITDNDTAAVTIADVAIAEGNAGTSLMTFMVTLNNAVQGGFTVNYAIANGTATTGDADYVVATGTLTFVGTAAETQTFTVTINGDTRVEGNETFTVSLNTVSKTGVTITDTATGTINNDDAAAITIGDVAQNENGTFTFTATLNNATGSAFSVDWALAAGATNAADYVGGVLPTGGTLNFAGTSGETETFTVPVFDDAVVEGTETFTISMTNFTTAGGFTVTTSDTAIGTITDNDTAAVTIADVAITEGNAGTSLMTFTVTLNNAVQGGFTVNYAIADGTATTGDTDYVAATGTLTFAGTAAETRTFAVTINGDTTVETDEAFTVSLNTVSKTGVTITDTATGTITNDDGVTVTIGDVSLAEGNAGTSVMTFTATLGAAVPGGFTVNYATANGTATTGDTDYVAATGTLTFVGTANETQTFTVTINGDAKVEPNETFTVSLNTVSNVSVDITDTATGTITNDDAASVTIGDVSLVEGNAGATTMTFTATLDNAVQSGFTVNYATANGTAMTADADYVNATGTLTFVGTAAEAQTFAVTINGDTKVEANETFTTSLNTVSNAAVTITDTATGTITNDDGASVTIGDVSLVEGNAGTTTMTFTATLDNAVQGGFTVNYATANGTATAADADYVNAIGTLTFAGTAAEAQTFTVTINGDTKVEVNETFTVSLNTVSNASVTITDTATGTITNDDGASVTIGDVSLVEGNAGTTTMTFTATLDNAVAGGFTVNYATADGTATTGDNDYVAATGMLTFAGTATETQTFTVTINGDTIVEANETLTVSLNTVSNASVTITDTATGTITNDDAAGYIVDTTATAGSLAEPTGSTTFTIRLASAPTGTVILDFGSTDTTECSVTPPTFTFNAGNWNTAETITIAVVDDLISDGTQPCATTISQNAGSTAAEYGAVANPANVSLTITDNETPGITVNPTLITLSESGGTTTFDLNANTAPTGAVSVPLTTDGQCEVDAGSGFGTTATVTLPTGSTAPQTVTARAVNDSVIEGPHTCVITTGNPTSATDAFYDALTAAVVVDVTANVTDNDVLHTLAAGTGGAEGTGTNPTYTFTITRSGATNVASSVDYTLGGTGVSGTDYVALNLATDITGTGVSATATTIAFAANATTATLTITVNADSIVEANFTLDLTLSNAGADGGAGTGTLAGTPATLPVTDDDTAGYIVDTTATAASIGEAAGVTTFTIRLTSQPTGTVILDFASTDATECTVSPATVTFNNANWNTAQTITITAVDDLIADGTQPCAITITQNAGSTDAGYAAVANPTNASVTVTDNETPGIAVNASLITSINELGGTTTTTFTIVLNTQPTDDVTIPLTSSDTTECTVSPTPLTFTALNWNTAQTVTITSVDDLITDGNQPCIAQIEITTSTDTNYNAQDPADVTITVVDNDVPGLTFSAATVTEGAASQTYTVQLNTQPTADVLITVITPDAQCTISGVTLPLTFTTATWNTPQTITVTAVDDAAIEGNHLCVIEHTLSSGDASYSALGTVKHTVAVIDNDSTPVLPTPTAQPSTNPVDTGTPAVGTFDPALSKVGVLMPGELGILGERLAWQITVFNTGTATGTGVIFTDTLRPELRVDEVQTSKGTSSISGQTVTVNIGDVAVGETINITILTTVLQSDITVNNTACVRSDTTGDECVTSDSLRTILVKELPATGETPWWVGWVQACILVVIGTGLLLGVRRVYLVNYE